MKLTGIPRATHLPRMARIKQQFAGPMLQDILAAVRQTLGSLALPVKPGQTVALAVGSRGIVNIDVIAKAAVDHVKALGAKPFIFPAMGSHGGGTAEGQRSVLEHYGITEATMGCPVRATMEVVQLGEALGLPVWLDRYASEADWIGIINRVKPHTDFVGGHRVGALQDDDDRRREASRRRPGTPGGRAAPLRADGAGLRARGAAEGPHRVRARHRGERIRRDGGGPGVPAGGRGGGERELLRRAKSWMARLPFEQIDVLIVDEMGKDISGSGMDSNIIGRHGTFFEPPYTSPKVTFIVVSDLTAHTYGNAIGLGSADFVTRRLADKIDWEATYVNGLTACSPAGCKMPATLDSAQEAIAIALSCLGLDRVEDARVVRIKNTLQIAEVDVSGVPPARGREARRPLAGGRRGPARLRRGRLPPAVLSRVRPRRLASRDRSTAARPTPRPDIVSGRWGPPGSSP